MKFFLLVLCAAVAATGATAVKKNADTTLTAAIERLIVSRKCASASVSMVIKNLRSDSVMAAILPDTMLNPASVTKLVTAAAAFEILGQGFRFTTRIFTDTVLARDSGLTVRNLYVQGGGDPSFTVERLWLLVECLHHTGLRKISGDLVIDDYFFDSVTTGPGLDEDTTSRAYQPLISALPVNFSTVAVHHRPGYAKNQPVIIDLFPEIAGVKISNTARTNGAKKKGAFKISTRPDSQTTEIIIEGTLPIDDSGDYSYRRLWQTWRSFGGALQPMFARQGIIFSGKVTHGRVPGKIAKKPCYYEFPGTPFARSIEEMFKYSSNFVAEMVFKTLSARRDTVQGSWPRSAALVAEWWKSQKLPGAPVIKNGSGMGNTNRISTAQIVALLRHVRERNDYYPEYTAALSVGGIDGTVKSRFLKSRLKGLVRAKTGTLNHYGVSTLAGYLMLDSGPYAFAIFCSRTGKTQYDDWMLQEKILEMVGDFIDNK
jgi:D-alanyl-D-alanine carboxypeptidase/D-alanyl-D-alanine-endopeptidase (penicillin-binding protein 4)